MAEVKPSPSSREVVVRFGDELRGFVGRRVKPDDLDDVYQDILLRIHRGIDGVQSSDRLVGWIYRVARHAIADYHRKARPQGSEPSDLPESTVNTELDEPSVVEAEVASWLRSTIEHLPASQRKALELVELEGMSQREFATREGLSPSGARTRVQRARKALRERLLRCCDIELDARGRVLDYRRRRQDCC